MSHANSPSKKCFLFGFTLWKRGYIKPFIRASDPGCSLLFCNSLKEALSRGLHEHSSVYIWGKRPFEALEAYAAEKHITLFRVEDGFIRSVSLGSDLTKPYSLVIDSRGIYFDPTQESDLEHILNTYTFDASLIQRAKVLQTYLVKNRISKYNPFQARDILLPGHQKGQRVVLVPGQVGDDASIVLGAGGMSNLELLKYARGHAPSSYIIYKPHPDVVAGNRVGAVEEKEALLYCNTIIEDTDTHSILELADEVHTMTSLMGFEALLQNKKVYTYGLPFYAGWGLTEDLLQIDRRKKTRTLQELVAAALILYPHYINPATNEPCEIETVLEEILKEKKRYNTSIFYKTLIDTRNMVSRTLQRIFKGIVQ